MSEPWDPGESGHGGCAGLETAGFGLGAHLDRERPVKVMAMAG